MKKILSFLSGRVAALSRAVHSPVLPLLRRGLGGGLAFLRSPFSVLLIALAMVFAGCEKNDDSNDSNEPPVLPDGPWDITLTVVPFYDSNGERARTIPFRSAAKQLVIDWGDGSSVETYINVTEYVGRAEFRISHDYTGSGTYTVRIQEEGLTYLYFFNTYSPSYNHYAALTSLDVSGCTALQELSCEGNQLTSLNVSGCTALQLLGCSENQLTSLDVSKCPTLQGLDCDWNQLTSLNVSGCTALQELNCYDNQLTSLDVSGCAALQELSCWFNQLISLDVSKCPALQQLYCHDNQLTAPALNTVFTALPDRTGEDYTSYISIYGNPGANSCNKTIAENKGWSVSY